MIGRRRGVNRLDPSQLRLPLIALIDVVLFLLMYFMIAGNLAAEERELTASLRTQQAGPGGSSALRATTLQVLRTQGRGVFRMGDRTISSREELISILSQLPKDPGVIIRAAPDAIVADTAAALQACKEAGFVKITYVAADAK